MNNIFYEAQYEGLCRMHSLNGYFGESKITPEEFQTYINSYDNEYREKYNFDSSSGSFDIVASDQKNIVNFILKKHGIYSRYYALNQIHGKNIQEHIINILSGEYFFTYNESHIWGCRIYNEKWYKVDSIGGVQPMNINSLTYEKNIGFIIPVNIKSEFYRNLGLIKSILCNNTSIDQIKSYLIQKNKEKLILDTLEIPINLCMDILDTNLLFQESKKNTCESTIKVIHDYTPIKKHIDNYNKFLSKFTRGNYNNIELILEYLPNIIFNLISLTYIV
jgi:hypothetical protein